MAKSHQPNSGSPPGSPGQGGKPSKDAARPQSGTIKVANDRAAIDKVQNDIVALVEGMGFPKAAAFAVRLSLHEAVRNAFVHGHKNLPQSAEVTISYKLEPSLVQVSVEDQGPGFDPDQVPDPTLDENLEVPSGRGLMLMRAYMSQVKYTHGGRRVEMTFRRPAAKA